MRKATAGLSGLTRVPKADSLQQASTALSDQLARSRSLAHRGAAAGATYAAVVGVLVALWITSAVLVAGFAVLATSDFALTADMGVLAGLIVVLALLADFLLLPPLLLWLDRLKKPL